MHNPHKRNAKNAPRKKAVKAGFASRSLVLRLLRQMPEDMRLEEGLQEIQQSDLSREDRAFTRMLLMSCLRFQYAAEKLALKHCPRNPSGLDKLILRLGVVQIVFMNVAPHAVLAETVALAPQKSRGFVNAVLHKVLRAWAAEPDQAAAKDGYILRNAPDWYRHRLEKDWGEGDAIMRAQSVLPPLDLAFVHTEARENFLQHIGEMRCHLMPHGGVRLWGAANPQRLPFYGAGQWWVQDAAAQLPVWLLRREVQGTKVLDLCAAPGGKTAQLMSYGANVVALDSHPQRLQRLDENMRRLNFTPEVVTADAREWDEQRDFDVVMVDAPCSASGTVRRHPENILRDHDPSLQRIQQEIFRHALTLLKPSGILLYAVCSLRPAEGRELCQTFAQEFNLQPWDFHAEDRAAWQELIRIDRLLGAPKHQMQTLPSDAAAIDGMDGFFIAAYKVADVSRG